MQFSMFAEETQLERLSKTGDSLEKLKIIDFETFRPVLENAFRKERKSDAGRPPFDVVMMFKMTATSSPIFSPKKTKLFTRTVRMSAKKSPTM